MKKLPGVSNWLWSLLGLGITLAAGCATGGDTGAQEEGELYNTAGIEGASLFDADGVAAPARTDRPFIRVGLMWDAGSGTHLEGRTVDPLGTWGGWRSIEPRWSEEGFHTGHLDVPGGKVAVGFQLRYRGSRPPSSLMAEAIEEVGEARMEPVVDDSPAGGLADLQQALAPASMVHTRGDWGARSPACSSGSHSPAKITVHHTATPLPDSVSVITRLRGIQNYHIDSRGWCDIGYHYLVDWNGEIWQGRYETTIGAHVLDNNTNNVGISFMGTYNSSSPTSAQLNKVAALMKWLHDNYGIPMNRTYVKGHREYRGNAAGDCPGDKVQAKLETMCNLASGGSSVVVDGSIKGVVFEDKGSGTADMNTRLPGATVQVSGGPHATAAPENALWSFSLQPGTYSITASLSGYQPASRNCSVTAGGEIWCSIGLYKETACVPDCAGRECGVDPVCGESCGACAAGETCDSGGQCVCSPDCTGQACGPDPACGQSCGLCQPEHACSPEGQCESIGSGVGKAYGYVVELPSEEEVNLLEGEPVGGALLWIDGLPRTAADEHGYYELVLEPGAYRISAHHDGHQPGEVECVVEEGVFTECFVPLYSRDVTEDPDGDEIVVTGGCATGGDGGNGWGWWIAAWIILRIRRRIQARAG